MSFFDHDGTPSINMADGFRAEHGPPPLADEAYVTYMPGDHLRLLIRGIRKTFPPYVSLIAGGVPNWGVPN
jgi:hypothetical protein